MLLLWKAFHSASFFSSPTITIWATWTLQAWYYCIASWWGGPLPPATYHPPVSPDLPQENMLFLHKSLPNLPFIYRIFPHAQAWQPRPSRTQLQATLMALSHPILPAVLSSCQNQWSDYTLFFKHAPCCPTSIFLKLFPPSGRCFPNLTDERNHQGNFKKIDAWAPL